MPNFLIKQFLNITTLENKLTIKTEKQVTVTTTEFNYYNDIKVIYLTLVILQKCMKEGLQFRIYTL